MMSDSLIIFVSIVANFPHSASKLAARCRGGGVL